MTKNDIITSLFDNQRFWKQLLKLTGNREHVAEDLRSEVMLALLKKEDKYIIDSHNSNSLLIVAGVIARNILYKRDGQFNRCVWEATIKKIDHIRTDDAGNECNSLEHLEAATETDLFTERAEALNEEIKNLHYFHRPLIQDLISLSVYEGNRWKHPDIKQVAANRRVDYLYALSAVKKSKQHLHELIQKNLKRKEDKRII